jgi:hypothetical protein
MTAFTPTTPGALEVAKKLADYADHMSEERARIIATAEEWEARRVAKQRGFWARKDAARIRVIEVRS